MSELAARAARAFPSGVARAAGPLLRVVPRATARAPRMPFVLLIVLLLGGGFVGLLLVNTSLQQGAFAAYELERRTAMLDEERQAIAERLALAEAPAALARRARALGMVPVSDPVFLRLPDGKVLGEPVPAEPEPVTVPEPDPAASVPAGPQPSPATASPAYPRPTAPAAPPAATPRAARTPTPAARPEAQE